MPQSDSRSPGQSLSKLLTRGVVPAIALSLASSTAPAEGLPSPSAGNSGYYTDPATGIVYQKVMRTIERPVVETQVRAQQSTVYRPETVVEVRPETRTVYTPVVSYGWEPRLRGRWNPFVQPTIQYEHTPRTHWEARSETVERRETRTNWVAEHRSVDVPQQVVKIQRDVKEDYEPVGRVAPPPGSPESAIASRLRPLDSSAQVVLSSSTDVARRSGDQLGIRATELYPSHGGSYVVPLPPASVARPYVPLYR